MDVSTCSCLPSSRSGVDYRLCRLGIKISKVSYVSPHFVPFQIRLSKYSTYVYFRFPARLKQNPRTLYLTLIITFISGANFFAVLLFWPSQAYNVYGQDPVGVGIRGIPIGFAVLLGACIVLWLLSVFRGHNRELMIISSCIMTAGVGSLASLHRDTLDRAWGLLVLAGLGIGGIVVPASIISTIICPDDLIATVAALTLAVRVLGGSVAYAIYYNVFVNEFIPNTELYIGGVMTTKLGITNATAITQAITFTGISLVKNIKTIPEVATSPLGADFAYNAIVTAGQIAYAESYRYVYLVSIAFGIISIVASCFLGNIDTFMDDHVAVVM